MKPHCNGFKRHLLCTAITLATISYNSYAAEISDNQTSSYTLSAGETLTITDIGAINVSGSTDQLAITGDQDHDGAINNDGTISASSDNDSAANEAIAIQLTRANPGDESNTSFLNTGTISAAASSDGSFNTTAYAVDFNNVDLVDTSFINTGLLSASSDSAGYARAFVVDIGDLSNTNFTNSGLISLTANSSAGSIYTRAIDIGQVLNDSSFTSGDITVSVSGETHATTYAIELEEIYGDSSLNGDITVSAQSNSGSANANLLYTEYVEGLLEHSGHSVITADGGNDALALGIESGSEILAGATVSNTGILNLSALAQNTAEVRVYQFSSVLGGEIYNSGTITGTATGASAIAEYVTQSHSGFAGDLVQQGTVELSANASGGTAEANFFDLGGALSGTISNSSTINLTASGSGDSDGYATAFETGDLSGTVTNTGTMTITAKNSAAGNNGEFEAYAFDLNGTFSGSIINSSQISISAFAENDAARAFFIDLNDSSTDNGTINNSGSINISATGSNGSEAESYGILMEEEMFEGSFINTGTFTLSAIANDRTASSSVVDAYGFSGTITNDGAITAISESTTDNSTAILFNFHDDVTGDLTNTATLTVQATSEGGLVQSYGLDADSEFAGHFNNSGNFTGLSQSVSRQANGYMISIGGNMTGTISNSGTITGQAVSESGATYQTGINLSQEFSGTIDNSGDIDVVSQSTSDSAYGYGISIDTIDAGDLINSGSVIVKASGDDGVYAYGFNLGDLIGADIASSGNIEATATATSGDSYSRGFSADSVNSFSDITIEDISASASATGNANSYAVDVDSLDGQMIINGTLNATSSGDSSSNAYGVFITSELDGTLVNNGSITATNSDESQAWALYISSGNGSVTNNGTLTGRLEIDDDVSFTNNGNINLSSTQGSTLSDFNQSSTGTLSLTLTDTGEYAQLSVNNTATLANGSTINILTTADSSITIGDRFPEIISAGSLIDSGVNLTDSSVLLDYQASIDSSSIDLTVVAGTSFSEVLSSSGRSFGEAGKFWDDILTYGTSDEELSELLSEFITYSSGDALASAIIETLPNGTQATGQTTNNVSGAISNVVSGRQGNTRGASGINTGDEIAAERNLWIKPFVSQASQDNADGAYGYQADTYGLALGADTELSPGRRIGAALFVSQSDIDINDMAQNSAVESYNLMVYGTEPVLDNKTYLDWQAGIGFHQNDSSRYISASNSTASADYDSVSAVLSASLSREYGIDEKTTITPQLKTVYQYQKSDAYEESGAGALNLSVASANSDRLIIGAAAEVERQLNRSWELQARAGVNYDLLNSSDSVTSSYAADPTLSFSTQGITPSAVSIEAGLGLNYQASDNLSLKLAYDAEASSGYDNQSLSAKLKWTF